MTKQGTAPKKKEVEKKPQTAKSAASSATSKPKKRITRTTDVVVRSGCATPLGFTSRVNPAYTVFWPEMGTENHMEFEYLMEMANTQRKFFERNWVIVPPDVLEALHVGKFYDGALQLEEFDAILDMPVADMAARLNDIPEGQRSTLVLKAKQLIDNGTIDSIKRIEAIEGAFGCNLRETN